MTASSTLAVSGATTLSDALTVSGAVSISNCWRDFDLYDSNEYKNLGIGRSALSSLTTGRDNVAIGYSVMLSNSAFGNKH